VLDSQRMFIEQVKLLYKRAPTAIPINILIAGILGIMLWPVASHDRIIVWWSGMTILCVLRFIHMTIILRKGDFETNPERLVKAFGGLAFATSVWWAVVFFEFAFSVPDVYIIFIIFSLGGMAVGAVASMVSMPRVFFIYTLPLVLPPIIVFLFQNNTLGFAMSSMMAIYYLSISSTYIQSYHLVKNRIQLQLNNENLIQDIKRSNEDLEIAHIKVLALSNTDELTQLSNRRSMDRVLSREWSRAVRSQLSITFIMFDIDYFKEYNDTFGHLEGDKCLQQVASILQHIFKRPGDCIARYGGEEFGAILPDTSIEGAAKMAQVALDQVAALHIRAANTTAYPFVTLSAGVACMAPSQANEMLDLVDKADAALYRAKHTGRNRIEQDNVSCEGSDVDSLL
jgi:diguanylate cyclase (GGDEF)-like protein